MQNTVNSQQLTRKTIHQLIADQINLQSSPLAVKAFPGGFHGHSCKYLSGKKKKKNSPTISELCRCNKVSIQKAAKAICSKGLYIHALQQLKHLPKRPWPASRLVPLSNNRAHTLSESLLHWSVWAGHNKRPLSQAPKMWAIGLYRSEDGDRAYVRKRDVLCNSVTEQRHEGNLFLQQMNMMKCSSNDSNAAAERLYILQTHGLPSSHWCATIAAL